MTTATRFRPSAILAVALALSLVPAALAQEVPPRADRFETRILPLLETYCVECHMEGLAESGVALDLFVDQTTAAKDPSTWLRVLDAVEASVMPPADRPQPTPEELQTLVGWIEDDLLAAQDASAPLPPTVIRRLNRREYDNTLRDLLGVDLGLAESSFPPDEIGYGFDNVGSALNISPAHVEMYLDAAERAVQAAIVLPDAEGLPPIELIGLRTYPLPKDTPVTFEHTLKPGRYIAEFSLVRVGIAETVPPPRLLISFGTDSRTVEAAHVQDETVVYRYWLDVVDGDKQVTVAFAPGQAEAANVANPDKVDATVSGDQRYGNDRGHHVDSMVVRGPVVVDEAALPPFQKALLFVRPGHGDEARLDAARRVAGRFAERAYRRPVSPEEIEQVLRVFRLADDHGESFERSIQLTLTFVLASPQFLFLAEPDAAAGDRPLNDFELASRLSYFLWSTMPDDALFDEARAGSLRSNLAAQVDRMLDDPRADELVRNFAGQWLQLRRLGAATPDPNLFPRFDETLRQAMGEETERFFAHIVRDNRPVTELLDANYTFLNEPLARHYGIDGVEGDVFRQVALTDQRRGGVLTQASVLTLTSNPNRTSPVKRGQWILQQILGTPPPPPPPDVPKLDDDHQADVASLRDRLELHRANPQCASCHRAMDPLGFALENYDAIGRWRDRDGLFPVDPSGELPGGLRFDDADDLKQVLTTAAAKKFTRSFIENMLTYALGRGLEPVDFPTVEAIRRELADKDNRTRTIIHGIVNCRSFQNRGAP